MNKKVERFISRREILRHSTTGLAAAGLAGSVPDLSAADRESSISRSAPARQPESAAETTVRQVIELIIRECAGKPFDKTVDTLKTGDPSWKVKGITTTFMATREVIEKTARLGANLLITHEPTFWNHTDEIDWLTGNPVYLAKKQQIERNRIAIWRCHDYWHTLRPDPVVKAFLQELGWEKSYDASGAGVCVLPGITLGQLSRFLRDKLKIPAVQVVGDDSMICRRVVPVVGASAGRLQMNLLAKPDIDAIIAGDVNEWEACEFVRDANHAGIKKAFLVIGHAASEEPGMRYLADWLAPKLSNLKVTHIPALSPFRISRENTSESG